MDRRFLVYCAIGAKIWEPKLFGANRSFDVALNSYKGILVEEKPEWFFCEPGYKLKAASKVLPKISKSYEFYAFLDDDIEVTTDQLNEIFKIAKKHRLEMFQPSLTRDSFFSHPQLLQKKSNKEIRRTHFVEVMMPFFSKNALEKCLPTFSYNESSWGLDLIVWPQIVGPKNIHVVDSVAVRHTRPVQSFTQKLSNGLTPMEEYRLIRKQYGRFREKFFAKWSNILITGLRFRAKFEKLFK